MEKFTQRLTELRKENGLTQQQLAEKVGTTSDSIYSWEKGRSQPSIEMICSLCRELGVSSDYLLGLIE